MNTLSKNKTLLAALIGSMLTMVACSNAQHTTTNTSPSATTSTQILEAHDATPPENIGIPIEFDGFIKQQNTAVAQPFVGLTTTDGKVEGLYPIKSTGVSTAPIVKAAQNFVDSLTPAQQDKTLYAYNSEEWRRWVNVDNGIMVRNGTPLKEMTDKQKALAFTMMAASLSAKGLTLSKDIMKTDQTLKELNNNDARYGEDLYFITIMGTPSTSQPWGWQIDGHHLAINYFVLGDQVVMTPTFMGGEPIITTSGKYKGNTLFQDEQNLGLQFMQSLPSEMQQQATLSSSKTKPDMLAAANSDNLVMDYEGAQVSQMSEAQKTALLNLIDQYISNMREGHAEVKMSEVKAHLDDTYFAWRGKTDDDAVFYYRIHSPVVMIEFDHQPYVGVHGQGRGVTRDHIHTMIRTPNGNDYGKSYLQQHLADCHAHGEGEHHCHTH